MKQQRKESSTRGYRRTGLDCFGIVMMFVLVACSLAIFARLMATKPSQASAAGEQPAADHGDTAA